MKFSSTKRNKSELKLVNSLQRGLAILEIFNAESPRLKFQEITQKTGLPKATVFRLLRTLVSLSYIRFDPESRMYSPAPRVMSLGFAVLASLDLREIARPYLEELSRVTEQTVNLGILDRTEAVYIDRVKKRQILNTDFHIGSRLNVYRSSMGKAILAFMSQEELHGLLNELLKDDQAAKYIGQNGERLMEVLEGVRQKGYALNDQELFRGLRAAAAPIFKNKGMVEAAVNIPVFSDTVSREELVEKYVPLLVKTAESISMARGFIKTSDGCRPFTINQSEAKMNKRMST